MSIGYFTLYFNQERKNMKRLNAVVMGLSLAMSAPVFADSFASVAYNFRDGVGQDDGTRINGYELRLGTDIAENTSVDLGSVFRTTEGVSDTQVRAELGLTQTLPLRDTLGLYARLTLGNEFTDADDFAYYSAEAGATVRFCESWRASLGYRYRDAAEQDIAFETQTIRAQVSRSLTQNSEVFLGYDRFAGDFDGNGVNLGFRVNF